MWFHLFHFVPKEPCSRSWNPDIALQSKVPRCLLAPTSNVMPNGPLCPDITGEAALQDDIGSTAGIVSGAFVRGKLNPHTINGTTAGQSFSLKIKASSSNSTFGINYSGVSVSAAYSLIIIKA